MYQSDLVDLLRPSTELPVALDVVEDAKTGLVEVEGATLIRPSTQDFLAKDGEQIFIKAINRALDNRLMRATYVNETSSRSHCLVSLVLKYREHKDGPWKFGKITFVDLAGSERLALIGFDRELYLEAIFIDESLQYLGYVVRNLALDCDYRQINYRASILTALLKDTLGGNSKTLLLCCISPSNVDLVATTDTLMFAATAALVKNQTGEINIPVDPIQKRISLLEQALAAKHKDWPESVVRKTNKLLAKDFVDF